MTETVAPVAKPVSRPRYRRPATASASALAHHLDCCRTRPPRGHMSVMKRQHYCGQFRYRPDRPDHVVSDIEPVFAATPVLRGARVQRPTARSHTLLSKPLPGGSLKVVVARAPRDLRSYQLGRGASAVATEAA